MTLFRLFRHPSSLSALKQFGVYGAGSIANRALPVLLLPVLTKYLTPKDYGIIATLTTFFPLFLAIIGLGQSAAIQRHYVDIPLEKIGDYVGTALLNSFVAVSLLSLSSWTAIYLINPPIPFTIFWVSLLLFGAFCQQGTQLFLGLCRMAEKAWTFISLNLLQTSVNLMLSLLLIIVFELAWKGRIIGIFCGWALSGFLSLILLRKHHWFNFRWCKKYTLEMFSFGLPLLAQPISSWILSGSDRLFLAKFATLQDLGLYSVGYSLGQSIQLLQEAFFLVWIPIVYRILKKDSAEGKNIIVKVSYLYTLGSWSLVAAITFCAPLILKLLTTPKFEKASMYVAWIAASFAMNGMYRLIVPVLGYAKRTRPIIGVSILAAITNLCLNYFLIKRNGPIGAAQATFCSFSLMFILTFIISQKTFYLPWTAIFTTNLFSRREF